MFRRKMLVLLMKNKLSKAKIGSKTFRRKMLASNKIMLQFNFPVGILKINKVMFVFIHLFDTRMHILASDLF